MPRATKQILLEHMPRAEVVDSRDAQLLWDARRGLFFKPVAGFGSRAAYWGEKRRKRGWQDLLASAYVAQAIVGTACTSVPLSTSPWQTRKHIAPAYRAANCGTQPARTRHERLLPPSR